jgi:Glycosyltransferase family 9 (heptosyltransferase)
MSLPFVLGITNETIRAEAHYLAADPMAVQRWRSELGDAPGLKVGINWAGTPSFKGERHRSTTLERWRPVWDVAGIRWFSLRVGERTDDLLLVPSVSVRDLSPLLTDFNATAAVITNLDLVITTDTSVAHLAGALGRPVWIALRHIPDWRWMLEQETSPWYPTARLFRQQAPGDWDEVFQRIAAELAQLVGSRSARGARRGG